MEVNIKTIYSSDQVKEMFHVGENGLTKYINSGALMPTRVGHRNFFSGKELLRFMEVGKDLPLKHSIVPTK